MSSKVLIVGSIPVSRLDGPCFHKYFCLPWIARDKYTLNDKNHGKIDNVWQLRGMTSSAGLSALHKITGKKRLCKNAKSQVQLKPFWKPESHVTRPNWVDGIRIQRVKNIPCTEAKVEGLKEQMWLNSWTFTLEVLEHSHGMVEE